MESQLHTSFGKKERTTYSSYKEKAAIMVQKILGKIGISSNNQKEKKKQTPVVIGAPA